MLADYRRLGGMMYTGLPLTVGSIFAGIGGFDLGLERAGMKTIWQVEIDPFCRRVLEKHWPTVQRFEDVRTVGSHNLPPVYLICGGFPCQDISASNYRGEGLDGERSGLWWEFHRIIGELRPRFAIVENVSAITFRGLDRVLGSLSEIGYDADWDAIPARFLGAPHARSRIFIVAYPASERCKTDAVFPRNSPETANAESALRFRDWPGGVELGGTLSDRVRFCPDRSLCRMVDGVPDRLDRYRVLGNAIVPQVAEWIGRLIVGSLQR